MIQEKMFTTKRKKITILFLGLDIKDMDILKSNEEFQLIYDLIEESNYKDYIQIIPALSIKRNQLKSRILKYRPQVLHFVGHGVEKIGAVFPGDDLDTNSNILEFDLISTINKYSNFIKLVIFNTCYTGDLAEKLKNIIDISIGVKKKVNDEGAIGFTKGFYNVFCNGDNIYNSFKNGITEYLKFFEKRENILANTSSEEKSLKIRFSARRDDYTISNQVEASNINIDTLLEINFWYDFLLRFNPEIQPLVQNLINLIISMDLDDRELISQNLCYLLEQSLVISISDKITRNCVSNFDMIQQKLLIKKVIEGIEDGGILFLIKLEDIFRKIIYILDNIIKELEFNSEDFKRTILTYSSHYLLKNPLFKDVKIEEIEKLQLENVTILEILKENFNKVLREYKNKNYDEIFDSDNKNILEYCRNHLNNADLSSKYGYRYDESFFIEDPKLSLEFEDFYNSIEDPKTNSRIFLLLGHMGLGKTWNVCFLAFRYVKIFPTFYFHLGSSYESDFLNLFGGFRSPQIEKIVQNFDSQNKKILLVFDGFDELLPDERKKFLNDLTECIKNNPEHLMVLLTSRLVDWINTEEISYNFRHYKQFIYNNDRYTYFDDIRIFTGASYILSDLVDEERLLDINERYGINYSEIQDSRLKKLLKKPFIINLFFRNATNLEDYIFDPEDPEWFRLFADPNNEDTILSRMGIFDNIEKIFQELTCIIADPYDPIPEDDLKDFIKENQYGWNVIFSSGIIKKRRKNFQEEFIFQDEYQKFIEVYISNLIANFHGTDICKADKYWLEILEIELKELGQTIKLQNITDLKEQKSLKGFICNEKGRVIELRLRKSQLPYFPNSIFKLLGLEKLDLKLNKLVRIHKSIGNLKNLQILDLSNNQLKKLPNSLLGLESLRFLNLEGNNIENLDSWWHDFKNLEYVCFYNNTISNKVQDQNPISINFIDDGLNFKDAITPKYFKEKEISQLEYLYIKDAVVINYLNEEKKIHKEITYNFEFDDFRINSLKITNPSSSLKPLFWSLERLGSLELVNRALQFGLNKSIKKLKISVPNKFESIIPLDIHDTISQLKELEFLHIEGFNNIKFPKRLTFLTNIKKLIIDSPKIKNLPLSLLELKIYSHVIINAHSKELEFNNIIENEKSQEPQVLLTYDRYYKISDLTIEENIMNLFISNYQFLSKNFEIKGIIKKLIICPLGRIGRSHFKNEHLWRLSETGNYIFVYEHPGSDIPKIKADFSNLTHFRFEHLQTVNLSEWMLESPNIKKLIITNEGLPQAIQDTFIAENKGLFQLRVKINCKIPEIDNQLKNLTHFQINLPGLNKLPDFISNLSRFKQLIITSKSLDYIWAPFDSPENEYRLLFKVANSCEFPRFLLQMKHLTHVWIDLPDVKKLPPDFELYFIDTKKIKLYRKEDIKNSITEYLKIPDPDYYIIKVHPNCDLPLFDEEILYKE
ncbi:MAG: hypothetical protein ACFFCV_06440 [Promethearchaeota archaeon]